MQAGRERTVDKYEYKLRADEIKTLIGEGRYAEAVQIADTIDWKKVKSVRMLCTIGDLYKINRRYDVSRDILMIANSRYPDGRYIIYSLCELSIKLQDIVQALEYFKEFVRIAPHNTSRYILQYKLYVAQDTSLEERIAVLQEFKKHDYREKWGYELAFLYHRVGLTTECIEECDELFLWFGGGRYVIKALELKALHSPLSPEQQKVYDRYRADGQEPEEKPRDSYDDDRDEMGHDEADKDEHEDGEFHVKTVDVGQYNTINLQQVIAESLRELQKKPAGVSQETKVMNSRGSDTEPAVPVRRIENAVAETNLGSAGDTGVLGITEEDLNAFEDAEEGTSQKKAGSEQPGDASESTDVLPGGADAAADMENRAFEESFKRTAMSIATDDTIWMPGIPEMAKYAAEQREISAQTIAQATGEIPMAMPVDTPHAMPEREDLSVERALEEALPGATEPAEDEAPPEEPDGLRQVEELRTDADRAVDEARRMRAEVRRAELRSREKSGRMREVSQDTRRMGQTREYVPIVRMDEMIQAAFSDKQESGQHPAPVPAQEPRPESGQPGSVVYPRKKQDEGAYDRLLTQGLDGQISLAVDGGEGLERQITGQISIGEFLTGAVTESKRPSREELAHQLAVLEGRIPPDAPAEAPTHKEDEQAIRSAEGEAAQLRPDAEAVVSAMQTPPEAEPQPKIPAEAETGETEAEEQTVPEPTTPVMPEPQNAPVGPWAPVPAEESTEDGWEEISIPEENESEEEESPEEAPLPAGPDLAQSAETEEEIEKPESGESQPEEQEAEKSEPAETETQGDDDTDVLRVMTPEEKELFGPYIHKKRSRRQIINAIDSLSMAAYAGNAIITGEEGAGTINLAKGLIRSIQLSDSNFAGQIAKISGRAMNRKRVEAIIDKLTGGALIIQGAAGMNNETTKALMTALQSENKGIIVILEDTRRGMEKYLKKHPEITECFNVRVDVEALATKELVAYAKQYALDREYTMDDFAILALHKRIDEMQTAEHEVTISEVREIVEEAIRRAQRKNPGHFFDILLQKRYDSNDMIILREKDFLR